MNQSQFQTEQARALAGWMTRLESATSGLSDGQLSSKPGAQEWSIAQICAHLAIPAEAYILAMKSPIQAPERTGSHEAALSWVGKQFIKLAGPQSNAPAPPPMRPPDSAGRESVARCLDAHREFIEFMNACSNVDLNRAKFKNPFLPFIRFRFSDGFAIAVAHSERHVLQIEDRLQGQK
jgi:hypothetical protein